MEHREKIRVAVAVASLTLLTLLFTTHYRRRRNQKKKCPPSSCYLLSEPKPQLFFKHSLADNSFSQFKHFNPHAHEKENGSNVHPYEAEINTIIENPKIVFEMDEITKKDVGMNNSFVWVENESQLKDLANALSKEKVFAVDTEQHSLRSFLGFTALIQISTGKEDYLVDTIALHDAVGVLRAVFADPGICKVFHGADNDVLWLQRDYHIYVVNLFDTAKACDVLSKPQRSLAHLLETYCGVTTNKLLQREDWRQRPLSAEMLQYAQTDAHYLLHIASCLIAELKQQDNGKFLFVLEASRRSNMICKQLYTIEIEDCPGESAASSIIYRHFNNHGGSSVSCETQDLVRRLCMWREFMGRVHDESLRYVLSDQAIASLAERVPASLVEVFDIIALADLNGDSVNFSSSLSSPSPVVCSHLDDLFYLIEDKNSSLDDIFPMLLQKCLGANATCPLSVYNYTLLVNDLQLTNRFVPKQNGTKKSKLVAKKSSRQLFVQKFSCKSQVYHNCRIYANDGRLLCYCDRRKLEWYLHRELAKLVEDDPPAIMLLFEPKGRPEDEGNDFYIQSKKNICVGCGEGSHYLRYRIIPSCYRMHFPEQLKSHRSHDIVLLCVDCHEVSHAAAEKYKKKIAAEFGIPLFVRKVFDSSEASSTSGPSPSEMDVEEAGVSPLQLRTAAMALLRHGSRMPLNRQQELIQIVKQYYGGRDISEQDLENALLVGMSPHERRRLHKKREKAKRKSSGSFLSDKEQMNGYNSIVKTTTENILDFDTRHGSEATKAEQTGKIEQNCFLRVDDAVTEPCTDLSADDAVATASALDNVNAEENEISGVEDTPSEDSQDNEKNPPKGAANLHPSSQDKSAPPSRNSKLSLLGHGPHGKQVVDYILSEHGEEGIREFCQRWRQVFVEALNPRFLPAGWDIKHSGRREFGEFSVYNPANKTSTANLS